MYDNLQRFFFINVLGCCVSIFLRILAARSISLYIIKATLSEWNSNIVNLSGLVRILLNFNGSKGRIRTKYLAVFQESVLFALLLLSFSLKLCNYFLYRLNFLRCSTNIPSGFSYFVILRTMIFVGL